MTACAATIPPPLVTQGTHFTPLSIPSLQHRQVLACGVDSLDLSMFVTWGANWPALLTVLQRGKHDAQGTPGGALATWPGIGTFIIFDDGRRPTYVYHIKTTIGNLWFAERQQSNGYANVFASIECSTIWSNGVAGAVGAVTGLIQYFGGTVVNTQLSRADVCVDTYIPGGMTFDLLRRNKKTRCRKINPHFDRDDLIGYDVGGGDVLMRLYDKSREILHSSGKTWMFGYWRVPLGQPDVWRTEFQVRRDRLISYGVDTIGNLQERVGAIWSDLTDSYFSLRSKRGPVFDPLADDSSVA